MKRVIGFPKLITTIGLAPVWACMILNHFLPIPTALFVCTLTGIIAGCYLLKMHFSKTKEVFIRVIPICHGKIYVVPNYKMDNQGPLDTPIFYPTSAFFQEEDYLIKEIKRECGTRITGNPEPRFCLSYKAQTNNKEKEEISVRLHILPLTDETQINYPLGRFVDPEYIKAYSTYCSPYINGEIEHLCGVIKIWEEFQ